MEKKRRWDAFVASLLDIYWPALAPDERLDSRPDPPTEEPAVPDDLWRVALLIYPDPEAWLHNPIPNQGMRTPLDLIARGEEEALQQILMEIAPFFLPDPSQIRPWSEGEER